MHITHIHTYTQAPTPSQTYTHAQSGHRLDEMKQSSGTAAHESEDEGESRFHASESDVPHLFLTMSCLAGEPASAAMPRPSRLGKCRIYHAVLIIQIYIWYYCVQEGPLLYFTPVIGRASALLYSCFTAFLLQLCCCFTIVLRCFNVQG